MYRYIIVDDEPLTRKGILKKLTPLSEQLICVGEASDGREGFQLVQSENPDIIITDMNMPDTDGGMFLVHIRESLPNIPIIIISGYKDFDYAQSAIEANACKYILKPFSKEEICNAMLLAIRSIEEQQENENLINTITEEQENIKYDYDIQMLKSIILGYQTIFSGFHSKRIEHFTDTNRQYTLFLLYTQKAPDPASIQDFLLKNELEDFVIHISNLHNNGSDVLLLSLPGQKTIRPLPFCKKIALALISYFEENGIVMSIGISDIKQEIFQLREAYAEASSALNSSAWNDTQKYYFYSSIAPDPITIQWPLEEEFLFRIETAEKEIINKLIYSLFDYCSKLPQLTLGDMKNYCTHLIQEGRKILDYYMDLHSSSSSGNAQNILDNIFSFKELQDYITIFFLNIHNMLQKNSNYLTNDVIEKVKLYVERKYYNDLNLDFLSSLFYMNRSYLSHLFKKTTGTTFNNYITTIRIEKAKELLSQTENRTYQIAKSVGYENTKYFFRIFKKETGMTPEEYRNTHHG